MVTRSSCAGPELLAECRAIGGCPTGEARLTRGYRLPAKYVIHTVGPVWEGGSHGEDELLERCYHSAFDLAEQHAVRSLAFPAIWLVAREPAELTGSPTSGPSSGFGDGVLAGLGFGALFVALSRVGEDAGLLPLALNQVVAGVVIVAVASALGAPWLPREPRAGLGAVSGLPASGVRGDERWRTMLHDAMAEVEAVARARGVNLRSDIVDRTLGFVDALPAESTASMQRDIAEGKPSELEQQNGAVVRLGEAAGVATPTHRAIYEALLPKERAARTAGG